MYFVEDRGRPDCLTRVMRSRYYAVGIDKLRALMSQAGFADVRRLDGRFYQPVLLGTRPGTLRRLASPTSLPSRTASYSASTPWEARNGQRLKRVCGPFL